MPELEIAGLDKSFGGLKAVSGLNLAVEEGELVGLIGPNGAGKTTVFNLVTGLVPATSGEIRFRGRSLRGLAPHRIFRLGIARTFQNIRLFRETTVLDNVLVVLDARSSYGLAAAALRTRRAVAEQERARREARELLDMVGLGSRAGELARSLPYGAQRRLEMARALAGYPHLLLLDEPAAGMNPSEVRDLCGLIRDVKRRFGLTVLLIEHQMGVVMNLCSRVVVMDFGQVIAEGSPSDIQRHSRVLEAYLGKRGSRS
ncbi:MAG: ABC transporter ATP-binding protein [Bacillota bacterium]